MATSAPSAFKASLGDDIRRFQLDDPSFPALAKKLADLFRLAGPIRITWRDADGDNVTIATEDDLQAARAAAQVASEGVVRVFVSSTEAAQQRATSTTAATTTTTPTTTAAAAEGETVPMATEGGEAAARSVREEEREEEQRQSPLQPGQHPGVVCDGCQGCVIGLRFKCCVCPDFDLCNECACRGLHADHTMLRIPTPQQPFFGLPFPPFGAFFGGFRRGGGRCHRGGAGQAGCGRWAGFGAHGGAEGNATGACGGACPPAAAAAAAAACGAGASCCSGAEGAGAGRHGRCCPTSAHAGADAGSASAPSTPTPTDIPVSGGDKGAAAAAAATGSAVPPASPAPASTSAQGGKRWEQEIQVLRDMGIAIDEDVLRRLLDSHYGAIAAVLSQLFAN